LQSSLEVLESLIALALTRKNKPQVVVCYGVVGLELDGLLELLGGLGELAFSKQDAAEFAESDCRLGVNRESMNQPC
jgi:hypothetical protein